MLLCQTYGVGRPFEESFRETAASSPPTTLPASSVVIVVSRSGLLVRELRLLRQIDVSVWVREVMNGRGLRSLRNERHIFPLQELRSGYRPWNPPDHLAYIKDHLAKHGQLLSVASIYGLRYRKQSCASVGYAAGQLSAVFHLDAPGPTSARLAPLQPPVRDPAD